MPQINDILTYPSATMRTKQRAELAASPAYGSVWRTLPTGGRVTFVTDDGSNSDYTILRPIFSAASAPCVAAIITNRVGVDGNSMTLANLQTLVGEGWELASHTRTHREGRWLSTEEFVDETRGSKRQLEEWGFTVNHIVWPFGSYTNEAIEIAARSYETQCRVAGGINRSASVLTRLNRVGLGSYFDAYQPPGFSATNTLAYYKQRVDQAKANNGWCIFMLHPWDAAFDTTQRQHLTDTIAYCQAQGVPVQTLSQVLSGTQPATVTPKNLLLQSERLDLSPWGNWYGSAAATAFADGTAARITATDSTGWKQNVTVTANTEYTFSVDIKDRNSTYVPLYVWNNTNNTEIGNTFFESQVTPYGYRRCSITFTTPTGCTSIMVMVAFTSGLDAYFNKAQLNLGGDNVPYVRTTTAAVS